MLIPKTKKKVIKKLFLINQVYMIVDNINLITFLQKFIYYSGLYVTDYIYTHRTKLNILS